MLTKFQQDKINHMKYCIYCGASVDHERGYIYVGMCGEHHKMWKEDIKFGLKKRNRLKEIQEKINSSTEIGNQLILNL